MHRLLIGRTYTDGESLVSVTPMARGGSAPNEYIDVYVHLATGSETVLVGENDFCTCGDSGFAATAAGASLDREVGFDDSAWPFSGALGVGYDENPNYAPFFQRRCGG